MANVPGVVVKVMIPPEPGKPVLGKSIKVPVSCTVHEFLHHASRKFMIALEDDHGLYVPSENGQGGMWLAPHRAIGSCHFDSQTVVELKRKRRLLRFKAPDGTIKTIMIEDTDEVGTILEAVCKKLGIKDHLEYGLAQEDSDAKTGFLNVVYSLPEQGVNPTDVVVCRKRFFANDTEVDERDPAQLHHLFENCKFGVLTAQYPCTREEAVELAALQCQVTYGNYRSTVMRPGVLNLSDILPAKYMTDLNIEAAILAGYQSLADSNMTEPQSKYRYIRACRNLKTYGITMFTVKETKSDGSVVRVLLGISRNRILRIDPETNKTLSKYKITQLSRWSCSRNHLTLDFGKYAKSLYKVETQEGDKISQLISGYIEIILAKRAKEAEEGGVRGGDDDVPPDAESDMPDEPVLQSAVVQSAVVSSAVAPSMAVSMAAPEEAPPPELPARKIEKPPRPSGLGQTLAPAAPPAGTGSVRFNPNEQAPTEVPDFMARHGMTELSPTETAPSHTISWHASVLSSVIGVATGNIIMSGVVSSSSKFSKSKIKEQSAEFRAAVHVLNAELGVLSRHPDVQAEPMRKLAADLTGLLTSFTTLSSSLTGEPKEDIQTSNDLLAQGQQVSGVLVDFLKVASVIKEPEQANLDTMTGLINAVVASVSTCILHCKNLSSVTQHEEARWKAIIESIKHVGKALQQVKPVLLCAAPTLQHPASMDMAYNCITAVQLSASSLVATTIRECRLEPDFADTVQLNTELKAVAKACTNLLAFANPRSCEAAVITITKTLQQLDLGTTGNTTTELRELKQQVRDAAAVVNATVKDIVTVYKDLQPRTAGPPCATTGQAVSDIVAASASIARVMRGTSGQAMADALVQNSKGLAIATGKLVGAARQGLNDPRNAQTALQVVTSSAEHVSTGVSAVLDTLAAISVSAPEMATMKGMDMALMRVAEVVAAVDLALVDASLGMLATDTTKTAESPDAANAVANLRQALGNVNMLFAALLAQPADKNVRIRLADALGKLGDAAVAAAAVRLASNAEEHQQTILSKARAICECVSTLVAFSLGKVGAADAQKAQHTFTAEWAALENTVRLFEEIVQNEAMSRADQGMARMRTAVDLLEDGAPVEAPSQPYDVVKNTLIPNAVRRLVSSTTALQTAARAGTASASAREAAVNDVVEAVEALSSATRTCAAAADGATSRTIRKAGQMLGSAAIALVTAARFLASDVTNYAREQAMVGAARDLTAAVAKHVTAVKSGRGAVAAENADCVQAVTALSGMANGVTSQMVQASLGSVSRSSATASSTPATATMGNNTATANQTQMFVLSENMEAVLVHATHLTHVATLDAAGLSLAAKGVVLAMTTMLQGLPGMSATVQDPTDQRNLLDVARSLATALGGLVGAAPDGVGKPDSAEAAEAFDAGRAVLPLAYSLLMYGTISALDQPMDPNAAAADEVVDVESAAGHVTAALERLAAVAPGDTAGLRAALVEVNDALAELVETARAATASAAGELRTSILDATRDLCRDTMEVVKFVSQACETRSIKDADYPTKVNGQVATAAGSASRLVAAAEALSPGEGWQDLSDPRKQAEQGLVQAATSVEAATAKLAAVTVVATPGANVSQGEQTLDGARQVVACIKNLMQAARTAQRELAAASTGPAAQAYFDGAWKEGLVGAAKSVAGATNELCEAASVCIKGGGEHSRLITAAREVSSSTAHLVLAAQVKAGQNSPAYVRLRAAAKAVKEASSNLVESVTPQTQAPSGESEVLAAGNVGQQRQLMQAKQAVLEMEMQLERERKRLLDLQKQQYEKR